MSWLLGSLTGFGQNLKVRAEADRLRVSAGQLHFLTGRALEKLHDGASVTYRLLLTIHSEKAGKTLARVLQRFTVSYDLWEEKFSATRLDTPARSASNLSSAKLEAWCLDNLSLPLAELPANRSFWVRLEFETEEPRDPGNPDNSPLTLSSLIDIFSRRGHEDETVRGFDEVGPLTLTELRKK